MQPALSAHRKRAQHRRVLPHGSPQRVAPRARAPTETIDTIPIPLAPAIVLDAFAAVAFAACTAERGLTVA